MLEREELVWEQGTVAVGDEGLRESYADLPKAPVRLIVCPLNKEVNHGGLLRAAEAFRIERISFEREEDGAVDRSGHRGTKRWQPYEWKSSVEAARECLRDGYHLVALSLSEGAVDIGSFTWPFPLALVIGSELSGVSKEIEELCEASVAIPLYGLVQSLNVATATAMALQEAIRGYRLVNPDFMPARQASRKLLR